MQTLSEINTNSDYNKDWTESLLMNLIDWEQEMADRAEETYNKQKEIDNIRRQVYYGDDRNYEQEDLQLAQDLRNLADRIERKYK